MILRALNPETERDLFRQAYDWRPRRKKHLQPDRMTFEEFSKNDSSQIVMGLFEDEDLIAVYMFREYEKGYFECHITTKKGASRDSVLSGALTCIEWFTTRGGRLVAWIKEKNKPLREFVEEMGFFYCGNEELKDTVSGGRVFCRYEVSPSVSQIQNKSSNTATPRLLAGAR